MVYSPQTRKATNDTSQRADSTFLIIVFLLVCHVNKRASSISSPI